MWGRTRRGGRLFCKDMAFCQNIGDKGLKFTKQKPLQAEGSQCVWNNYVNLQACGPPRGRLSPYPFHGRHGAAG